jgi:AcrR family transcriptional regulator
MVVVADHRSGVLGNDPLRSADLTIGAAIPTGSGQPRSGRGIHIHRKAAETREHVLQVARDLFYWNGIRATGIDKVAAEAGVAPTTLYRLFSSKDDLVAAYVEREDRHYREWLTAATEAAGAHPRDRILAIFDALADQVQPDFCRGCAFQMTLAEFPDPAAAAHQHAVAAKAWVRARLGEITDELGVSEPAELADQLALIIEGVYASTQALGPDGPSKQARSLAETLLAAAER